MVSNNSLLAIDLRIDSIGNLVQYWMSLFEKWSIHFFRKVLSGEN